MMGRQEEWVKSHKYFRGPLMQVVQEKEHHRPVDNNNVNSLKVTIFIHIILAEITYLVLITIRLV